MAFECQNCGSEIPEGFMGPEDAVQDGLMDKLVILKTNPENSVAVEQAEYFCNSECFIEHHD
mgnify:CR=1 FL=1